MAICLNVAIMVVGFFITQEASSIEVYITMLGSKKTMSIMFWSASVVLSIFNIGWIAINIPSSLVNDLYIKLVLVLILFFMIFEIITIHLLTKNIRISLRICCITKPIVFKLMPFAASFGLLIVWGFGLLYPFILLLLLHLKHQHLLHCVPASH